MEEYEVNADPINRIAADTIGIRVGLSVRGSGRDPLSKLASAVAMLIWVTKRSEIVNDLQSTNKYDLIERYQKDFAQDQKNGIEYIEGLTSFQQSQEMVAIAKNHIEFMVLEIAAE